MSREEKLLNKLTDNVREGYIEKVVIEYKTCPPYVEKSFPYPPGFLKEVGAFFRIPAAVKAVEQFNKECEKVAEQRSKEYTDYENTRHATHCWNLFQDDGFSKMFHEKVNYLDSQNGIMIHAKLGSKGTVEDFELVSYTHLLQLLDKPAIAADRILLCGLTNLAKARGFNHVLQIAVSKKENSEKISEELEWLEENV